MDDPVKLAFLTPKEQVRERHPGAWCVFSEQVQTWVVMDGRPNQTRLGSGCDGRRAWADAAKNIAEQAHHD